MPINFYKSDFASYFVAAGKCDDFSTLAKKNLGINVRRENSPYIIKRSRRKISKWERNKSRGEPQQQQQKFYVQQKSVSTQVQSTKKQIKKKIWHVYLDYFISGQCTHFKESSTRCRRGNLRSWIFKMKNSQKYFSSPYLAKRWFLFFSKWYFLLLTLIHLIEIRVQQVWDSLEKENSSLKKINLRKKILYI